MQCGARGYCSVSIIKRWLPLVAATTVFGSASLAADVHCPPPANASGRSAGPTAAEAAERFRCARSLAQDGEFRAAIREYQELSLEYPDNVDYLFGEGQARFWSGDRSGALALLTRARRLAPAYEDVWRLEYQVLNSVRGQDARERAGAFRAMARQRFPDAAWLKSPHPPAKTADYYWELGMNVESLDNGASDWQNVYAVAGRRTPADTVVHFSVTEYRRFALEDDEFGLGGSFKPAESWIVDGAVRLSPGAAFLPETVADVGLSRLFADGWIAGIDVGQRRYDEQTVDSVGLQIERYFGRFRAAWQLQNTRLGSASSFVHIAALNYYAESGSRYGVTASAGDEVELAAPGTLLEMDVSALALTGRHPIGERLEIAWRIGTHRQGSFYRRNTVGLSIAGNF